MMEKLINNNNEDTIDYVNEIKNTYSLPFPVYHSTIKVKNITLLLLRVLGYAIERY